MVEDDGGWSVRQNKGATLTGFQNSARLVGARIREIIGDDKIFSVFIDERDDSQGEPSIYASVSMKVATDIPDSKAQNDLTLRLIDALRGNSDMRFPYVYFGALDESLIVDETDEADAPEKGFGDE